MDLTEAEDIKKWQEYTEELYAKALNDLSNHNGVVTDLKPDILECEVKWTLGNFTTKKLMEVMEFLQSYFKFWKMLLLGSSATLNMPANLENSAMATGLEKASFHSNSQERQSRRIFKLPHNFTHFTF